MIVAPPRRQPDEPPDRGSYTLFVAVLALALFAMSGLAVDGGRQLDSRAKASSYAEEAARAGALHINAGSADVVIDVMTARQSVNDYCAEIERADAHVRACCPVDITGQHVVTHVDMRLRTVLLSIVGVTTMDSGGTAVSRPVQGVAEGEPMAPDAVPDDVMSQGCG